MRMNRRSALGILAGASTATALAIVPAQAQTAQDAISADVNRLLEAYETASHEEDRLSAAFEAAYAQLPEWARDGGKFLKADGSYTPGTSAWPMVPNAAPDTNPMVYRNVRPSLEDIDQNFAVMMPPPGFKGRKYHRAEWFRRRRAWIARVREQRSEREKVGLPALEAAADDAGTAVWEARYDLLALEDRTGNADYIGCMAYLAATSWGRRDPALDQYSGTLHALAGSLRSIHPSTTGYVREAIGRFLAGYEAEVMA
ncbi:hypothetical protein D3218_19135 [Aureimonas flava]|uniref:Tat pathway signal protein n=1 Tax=Aureimonas flava TaxID=2320271 RepID=A0A3A1WNP5_9HYPH|nr:hypothetical protein [Aureimonas flava]RIX97176.1 hypothetical protein D3218_19135 [Aureimonas flava]